jgi:hypothetical protein
MPSLIYQSIIVHFNYKLKFFPEFILYVGLAKRIIPIRNRPFDINNLLNPDMSL